MNTGRLRIYLTGVGGQGTLTATTLVSRIILDEGLDIVSGEIHGMAQRGGVVESTILIGGWKSPSIYQGEADVILGFEALETLRGLAYLAPDGAVFSSSEFISPSSVSAGKEHLPSFASIRTSVLELTSKACFLPIQTIGKKAGAIQSGNSALLGAFFASGILPFGVEVLKKGVEKYMPAKVVDINLRAIDLGVAAIKIE